jgi:polyhydroxyalkanoate synthesis regulator phasin
MNLIPVEGERNLARDMRTNAIINTNEQEYNAYLARKNSVTNEKQRIENLENQINEVKDDLNEIKMLLRRLSNGS